MEKLAGPVEGGGFREREAKIPLHEHSLQGNALTENLGDSFTVRMAIGPNPKNIMRFPKVPTIPIEVNVPELDAQSLSVDGWESASVTMEFTGGALQLVLKGKFGRSDDRYYFVTCSLARVASGDTADDSVVIVNKDDETTTTSLFDIMQIRLKSGDPKFARFSDKYPSLDTEGVVAMITRYMKDFMRNEEAQEKAAQDAAAAPQPTGGPQ